ncbi:MAG: hypothetical protein ABI790_01305 [Betaproteobacteria bacterium]
MSMDAANGWANRYPSTKIAMPDHMHRDEFAQATFYAPRRVTKILSVGRRLAGRASACSVSTLAAATICSAVIEDALKVLAARGVILGDTVELANAGKFD